MSSDNTQAKSSLAYRDAEFLESSEARSVRILSEYLRPLRALRLAKIHDTIVFFGSARLEEHGPLGRYYREARELARLVTIWGNEVSTDGHRLVVCTGGGGGIMEAANRGALDAGGPTIGLNIGLPSEQRPNSFVTPGLLFEFHYFFMRKFWFTHLARAMVVFPGGFGTLDELFEMLTLIQTRKLETGAPIILYGKQFWDDVMNLEALAKHGMIAEKDLALIHRAENPEAALNLLKSYVPTETPSMLPAIAKSISLRWPSTKPPKA